jgi:hypothetical protein
MGVEGDGSRVMESAAVVDAAMAEALARLVGEFPDMPDRYVEELLVMALARTAEAPVGTFRVVLAERATRARLFAEAEG